VFFEMFAGHATVGAWLSTTVTVNVQGADMLLEVSVAWQDTVVMPFGKTLPEAGLHEGVAPGQLSLTVGVKLTTAVHRFGSVFWVMGFGQVIVGASLSLIVTVNVQLGPAVVEQVTVVTPFGKLAPDAGLQVTVPHVPVVVGAE
jgi:hypothetical protein